MNQKVQIISMSWTIKQPENRDVKKRFDDAVRRAIDSGILLFCSAGDKGAHKDSDYPVASNPSKIFRIGAAKPNGNVWDWVGDINSLDFIIPGFEVFDREDPLHDVQAQTGSSVATALGAGLAALIFCCVQLAAMHTQMSQPPGTKVVTAVKREHLGELKNHEKMKAALENIGTSKESQNKFIEVWKAFDKDFQNSDKEKNWELVTGMARDLL